MGKIQHLFTGYVLYFPYRTKKEQRLYFFSHDQAHMTYIPNIMLNLQLETLEYSAIWADTDIRLMVKTTAQSVRTIIIIPDKW